MDESVRPLAQDADRAGRRRVRRTARGGHVAAVPPARGADPQRAVVAGRPTNHSGCSRPARVLPSALASATIILSLAACATVGAPSLEQIRSGTLRGVTEEPITLRDGAYVGPAPQPGAASSLHVTLWEEPVAFGDLDGLPGDEAVVLLSTSTGGSGSFLYIAAFGWRDGHLTPATATLVGDRVRVLALSIAERRVTLDIMEAGPGDALCCPSRLARKTYAWQGGVLVPVATAGGSLADLSGTEWTLTSLDDRSLPQGVRPPSLIIDGTRVAGFAGCNRYAGTLEERTPGVVTISSLATTSLTCAATATDIERRYLAGLTRVSRYTVVAGRLQLIHVEDGTPRPLTFERRASSPGEQLR